MWHFSTLGVFTVRTTYHVIRRHWGEAVPTSSSSNHQVFWNKLWSLVVPPRIKMFLWCLCVHALPTKVALSERDTKVCVSDAVVVKWGIWNNCNNCIFRGPKEVVSHALSFVREFEEANKDLAPEPRMACSGWRKPSAGVWKFNFDGAKLGSWGHGWSMVVRDSSGAICATAVQQGTSFCGPEATKANACLFVVKKALELDYEKVIVEGDCLSIIAKLRARSFPNMSVGLILAEIVNLSLSFVFCSFSHVKRMGNRVAHTLAHL
ncbi:hypothetical protein Cgig2_005062 [Carnegiea gigantea]|uniref:RNase H type-1 domain-containing protein n=1 Tax=Carnegiea gigantea TaxID=171969 RepID=A0A9Q1KXP0_9CARY|nr:hypothetical protein Cgig2_005062 [Carnegiea gigantea]